MSNKFIEQQMEHLTTEVWIWIGVGTVMIFLEFLLPGLFVVFLGSAAIITGFLIHFHVLNEIVQSLIFWMGLSMFLLLTIRPLAARFFLSDEEYRYTEDDDHAVGQVVTVTKTVNPDDTTGRIRYQGTDWPARSVNSSIEKGSHAVIKYRDNISWVIDKYDN